MIAHLILHRHDYLPLPAPLTIDYKTLKNNTISVVFKLGSLLYKFHFHV